MRIPVTFYGLFAGAIAYSIYWCTEAEFVPAIGFLALSIGMASNMSARLCNDGLMPVLKEKLNIPMNPLLLPVLWWFVVIRPKQGVHVFENGGYGQKTPIRCHLLADRFIVKNKCVSIGDLILAAGGTTLILWAIVTTAAVLLR